jgi:hypothetical protein
MLSDVNKYLYNIIIYNINNIIINYKGLNYKIIIKVYNYKIHLDAESRYYKVVFKRFMYCYILTHIVANDEKVLQGDVSFNVKNVDLTSLRQKSNCKQYEGENDRNRCAQACWRRETTRRIPTCT